MTNFGNMMKQAQKMQAKMMEMQEYLSNVEVQGSAGGGMVIVTMTGKTDVKKVEISHDLMKPSEKEVLEDLIVAAFNDAKKKAESFMSEETKRIMEELGLPTDLELPKF